MERFEHDRLQRLLDAVSEVDGPARHGTRHPPRRAPAAGHPRLWLAARALGGLAVLAVGAVHLQQYVNLYSAIPTIGTLFVLNFAGATCIGIGLLAPLERVIGARRGGAAVVLLAIAGIGLAATSFAFLAISEQTPLFGFMEPGYDPTAILAARVAEGAAVVSLGAFLVARLAGWATGRW